MMDPIDPWLDPAEVRRLAESLMQPHHLSAIAGPDAGFGQAFVGYAASQEPQATPVPVIAPAPAPPAQVTTASVPLLARITRFRDGLQRQTSISVTGVFILGPQGTVVYDAGNHRHLYALARSLAASCHRPSAIARNVRLQISAQTTLELIPVETPDGWLVLGATVPHPLAPTAVAALATALASPGGGGGSVGAWR